MPAPPTGPTGAPRNGASSSIWSHSIAPTSRPKRAAAPIPCCARSGPRVALEVRREAARSLAGLPIDPNLVIFFAEDSAGVAAPLVAAARLPAAAWLAILPRLGPAARALLRHREDLDPEVRQALVAFGPSDFVLEGAVGEAETPGGESQIRELVARIEAYRRHRDEDPAGRPAHVPEPGESFRWRPRPTASSCGSRARRAARWSARASPRSPGRASMASTARPPAPSTSARRFATPASASPATRGGAGDWRISGIPYFDPARGSFLGYRGTARRPRPDEIARLAAEAPPGVFGTAFPADSLRQLIHELRTPLNAIIGFAEMIEGQYMGPAAAAYRGQAGDIVAEARGLLGAVDDLDTAARIESRRLDLDDSAVDAVALLSRLHDSYARIAAARGASIAIAIAEGLPLARVEPGAAERMFARLLAGTIGLAGEGETIAVAMNLAAAEGAAPLVLAIGAPPRSPASVRPSCLTPATARTATGRRRRRSASASLCGWSATSPKRSAASSRSSRAGSCSRCRWVAPEIPAAGQDRAG